MRALMGKSVAEISKIIRTNGQLIAADLEGVSLDKEMFSLLLYTAICRLHESNVSVLKDYYRHNPNAAKANISLAEVLNQPFDQSVDTDRSLFASLMIDRPINNEAEKKAIESIAFLFIYQADVSAKRNGRNLLAQAIDKDRPLKVIWALVDERCQLSANFQDKNGNSPLKYGIDQDALYIVADMLEQKNDPADPNGKIENIPAIEYAVNLHLKTGKPRLALIDKLIEKNPKISMAFVKEIVAKKVSLAMRLVKSKGFNPEAENENLLDYLLESKHEAIDDLVVQLLNDSAKTKMTDHELIFTVIKRKLPKAAATILDRMQKKGESVKDLLDDHGTLIVTAVNADEVETARKLIQMGLTEEATELTLNRRVLQIALEKHSEQMVELLATKTTVRFLATNNQPLLMLAAEIKASARIFTALISKGADIFYQQLAVLNKCLELKNIEAALYLLQVICEQRNAKNQTALAINLQELLNKFIAELPENELYKMGETLSVLKEFSAADNENLAAFFQVVTLQSEQSNCCKLVKQINALTENKEVWIRQWAKRKLEEFRNGKDLLLSAVVKLIISQSQPSVVPVQQQQANAPEEKKHDGGAAPAYEVITPSTAEQVAQALINNSITLLTIDQMVQLNQIGELNRLAAEGDLLIKTKIKQKLQPAEFEKIYSAGKEIIEKTNWDFPSDEQLCALIISNKFDSNSLKLTCLYLLSKTLVYPEFSTEMSLLSNSDCQLVSALAKLILGKLPDNNEPLTTAAKLIKSYLDNKLLSDAEAFELIDSLAAAKGVMDVDFQVKFIYLYQANGFIRTLIVSEACFRVNQNVRNYQNANKNFATYFQGLCALNGWKKFDDKGAGIPGQQDLIEAIQLFSQTASKHKSLYVKALANLKLVECYRKFNLPHLDQKADEILNGVVNDMAGKDGIEAGYLQRRIAILKAWQRPENQVNNVVAEQKEPIAAEQYYYGTYDNSGVPNIGLAVEAFKREIEEQIKANNYQGVELRIAKLEKLNPLLTGELIAELQANIVDYKKRCEEVGLTTLNFDQLLEKFNSGNNNAETHLQKLAVNNASNAMALALVYTKLASEELRQLAGPIRKYEALKIKEVDYLCSVVTLHKEEKGQAQRNENHETALQSLKVYADSKRGSYVFTYCVKAAEYIMQQEVAAYVKGGFTMLVDAVNQALKRNVGFAELSCGTLYGDLAYCNKLIEFCDPVVRLRDEQKMKLVGNGWFTPDALEVNARIDIIKQHRDRLQQFLYPQVANNPELGATDGSAVFSNPANAYPKPSAPAVAAAAAAAPIAAAGPPGGAAIEPSAPALASARI